MLNKKIIWKGISFQSLENCDITVNKNINIKSTITGEQNNQAYVVEYDIKINENWKVLLFGINTKINGINIVIEGYKDLVSSWVINDKIKKELNSCIDIDISLTPFTNTLPINRLKLNIGESKQISVLYIDVLENKISLVKQLYSKISETQYNYKNILSNFQELITIDEDGLVTDYPGLFERVTIDN